MKGLLNGLKGAGGALDDSGSTVTDDAVMLKGDG